MSRSLPQTQQLLHSHHSTAAHYYSHPAQQATNHHDFSTIRNSRLASIASVNESELSRSSSLQPCVSRASNGSRRSRSPTPTLCAITSAQRKSLERLPSHVKCTYSPPSYDESHARTFRNVDEYGNEWRCRLGVWYVVRQKGPRKSSTKPSDAPIVVNGKEWRKRFGVWCASRS